jgi:hypothetical protein
VNQKYPNIKRRLFPHGGVARRCHSLGYVASSRLALRKNPSVSFVLLFLIHDTSRKENAGNREMNRLPDVRQKT